MPKILKFILFFVLPSGAIMGVGGWQYLNAARKKAELEKYKRCSDSQCCKEKCNTESVKKEECKGCCDTCPPEKQR